MAVKEKFLKCPIIRDSSTTLNVTKPQMAIFAPRAKLLDILRVFVTPKEAALALEDVGVAAEMADLRAAHVIELKAEADPNPDTDLKVDLEDAAVAVAAEAAVAAAEVNLAVIYARLNKGKFPQALLSIFKYLSNWRMDVMLANVE